MSSDPNQRTLEENEEEYHVNMHAIQSCIALGMNRPEETGYGDLKHMQVGIVSLFVNDHAMMELLIKKGITTREEYVAQLVLSTRQELNRLTEEAQARVAKMGSETKIEFL